MYRVASFYCNCYCTCSLAVNYTFTQIQNNPTQVMPVLMVIHAKFIDYYFYKFFSFQPSLDMRLHEGHAPVNH